MSLVTDLYKQLISPSRPKITLEFDSEDDFQAVYAQLRNLKSKENAAWEKLFNESFFGQEVIRVSHDPDKRLLVTFSFEPRKDRSKTKFKVVSINPSTSSTDHSTSACENTSKSGT